MRHLLDQTVTILRYDGSAADAFGNARPVWGAEATTYPGRLRRLSADEVISAGEQNVADWMLYLMADATITSKDRVRVGGQVYELAGDPYYVHGLSGAHHLEARIRAYGG